MINGRNALAVVIGLLMISIALIVAITLLRITGNEEPSIFPVILTSSLSALIGAIGVKVEIK